MTRKLLAAAVLAALAATSSADERILSFHSDVAVAADGTLTVRETIQVRCENKEIRRGIYRDFPVRYAGGWFTQRTVPFRVVEARRNGQPEQFRIEDKSTDKRVYFGRADVTLAPGVYTYTLTYRTARQIGFFDDHDELYWNVTGNAWSFPIDRASATVILPPNVPADQIKLAAYTGPKGARGTYFTAAIDPSGRPSFQTTRSLMPNEGLSVVVSWPKGIVSPPSRTAEWRYIVTDNPTLIVGAVGFLIVLGYYLLSWSMVGRDPQRGVIIPLFEPPPDLCPAAVRYVWRMGFDSACFVAACVSMAVKGYLNIVDDSGDYRFVLRDDADPSRLSEPERKAGGILFRGGSPLPVDRAHWQDFQSARDAISKTLDGRHKGTLFVTNARWFAGGVILSLVALGSIALAAWWVGGNPVVPFLMLWLTIWTVGTSALLWGAMRTWQAVLRGSGGKGSSIGAALGITLFATPFLAGEVIVLGILTAMTSLLMLPIWVGLFVLNFLFFTLLKRPTLQGRIVLDQIDGFRMYLRTTEDGLLRSASHPPTKTAELFEKYLPHALALGCEDAWADKFAPVLAAAAAGGAAATTAGLYVPIWYHGGTWTGSGPGGLASALSGSLAGALSIASTAPGSSSGFGGGGGGGGGSGGGGGGGGGGGW